MQILSVDQVYYTDRQIINCTIDEDFNILLVFNTK